MASHGPTASEMYHMSCFDAPTPPRDHAPWIVHDTLDSLAGLCVLFWEGPPLPLLGQAPPPPPLQPPASSLMVKSVRVFVSTTLFSLWLLLTLIEMKDLGKTPLCPPGSHPEHRPCGHRGQTFPTGFFCLVFFFFPFGLFPSQEKAPTEKSGVGCSRLQPRTTV